MVGLVRTGYIRCGRYVIGWFGQQTGYLAWVPLSVSLGLGSAQVTVDDAELGLSDAKLRELVGGLRAIRGAI